MADTKPTKEELGLAILRNHETAKFAAETLQKLDEYLEEVQSERQRALAIQKTATDTIALLGKFVDDPPIEPPAPQPKRIVWGLNPSVDSEYAHAQLSNMVGMGATRFNSQDIPFEVDADGDQVSGTSWIALIVKDGCVMPGDYTVEWVGSGSVSPTTIAIDRRYVG